MNDIKLSDEIINPLNRNLSKWYYITKRYDIMILHVLGN